MFGTMWLRILCVVVVASTALGKEDRLLNSLYGEEGRNKVEICVGTAGGRVRRCDGALFNREWVVARAGCLRRAASDSMATERLSAGGSCDHVVAGNPGVYRSRAVQHHVMHPWFDLAIVIVKTPYNNLDKLSNATSIRLKLKKHG
uniref:Peptidase S1 domain-containing protein n=1 Tax=Heliothis virescens TaxID=7102 RepID=A0A2A4JJ52_HELVI